MVVFFPGWVSVRQQHFTCCTAGATLATAKPISTRRPACSEAVGRNMTVLSQPDTTVRPHTTPLDTARPTLRVCYTISYSIPYIDRSNLIARGAYCVLLLGAWLLCAVISLFDCVLTARRALCRADLGSLWTERTGPAISREASAINHGARQQR